MIRVIFVSIMVALVRGSQHQFFKDAGTAIEHTGYVYTYSTFIYEKILFTIPPFQQKLNLTVCRNEQQAQFEEEAKRIWNDAINLIQGRIDLFDSNLFEINRGKNKRLVPLLIPALVTATSAMNLGMSLYNAYQVGDLYTSYKELSRVNEQLSAQINRSTEKIEDIINKFNQLNTVVIPEIFDNINQIRRDQACYAQLSVALADFYHIITNVLINRVIAGIDNIYVNRLTPDFLPLKDLKNTLLKREDVANSLYAEDTTLMYRLGSFVVKKISHNPFLVSGILILPKLLKEHVGGTISISKVPIFSNDTYQDIILDVPDFVIQDNNLRKIWSPNFDVCLKQSSTFFCPIHEVRTNPSTCLENMIFHSNIENCSFKYVQDYPLIKQTSFGLMISPRIKEIYKVQNDKDGKKKIDHIVINIEKPFFLSKENGSEFIINKQIYYIELQVTTVLGAIELHDFQFNIPEEVSYQHVETIKQLEFLIKNNSDKHNTLYIILITIIILIISITAFRSGRTN